MENFTVITMLTKTNKKLYLEMIDGKAVWTFKKSDACYFDNSTEAENFANKWFKNFSGWKTELLIINADRL